MRQKSWLGIISLGFQYFPADTGEHSVSSLPHLGKRDEFCICCGCSLLSRVRLCDPMDCSPPGCSVHGIFPAGIWEWLAISSSRGSSWSRNWTCISWCLLYWQVDSLPLVPPGKPKLDQWKGVSVSLSNKLIQAVTLNGYM